MVSQSNMADVTLGRFLHMTVNTIKVLREMVLLPRVGLRLMTGEALLSEIAHTLPERRRVMRIVTAHARHPVSAPPLAHALRYFFDMTDRTHTLIPLLLIFEIGGVIGKQ